jgi:hypothetical protein
LLFENIGSIKFLLTKFLFIMKVFTKIMSLTIVVILSSALVFGQTDFDQFKMGLVKKSAVPELFSGPVKANYIPNQTKDILWTQMSPSEADGACAAQDFEAANNAYDCRGADDFIVTSGPWNIGIVRLIGAYWNGTGPAEGFNIEFFNDASGMPGTSLGNYSNLAYTEEPIGTSFIFTVELPSPITLANGNYWIAMQARMDFSPGGQFGLLPQLPPQIQDERMWICPGGGFPGATNWVTGTTIWPTQLGKDWCFELESGAPPLANDLTVMSIEYPISGSNLGTAEPVTIRIKNLGSVTQSNFPVYYTLDGGAPVTETVTESIASLQTYDYTCYC